MDELNNLFGSAEQLWQYIKNYAAKAGREATRTVLELYYVLKSPHTPAIDKAMIVAALGYQLLPRDLMSREKYGWLGFLDNGVILALAYKRVKDRVSPQIDSQVETILDQWFGKEQKKNLSELESCPILRNDNSSGRFPEFSCGSDMNESRPSVAKNTQKDLTGDEDVVID